MQLRVARLCLDCEEVHDAQICPRCTSETFAFLSRWIQAPERRTQPRTENPNPPRQAPRVEQVRPARGRWLKRGALLAALGVGGWLWRQNATKTAPRDKMAEQR